MNFSIFFHFRVCAYQSEAVSKSISVLKMRSGQFENEEDGGGYDIDPKQRPPPSKYQVRPLVDPNAEGEVDPNL